MHPIIQQYLAAGALADAVRATRPLPRPARRRWPAHRAAARVAVGRALLAGGHRLVVGHAHVPRRRGIPPDPV